jgi:hypothetical protein
MFAFPPAAGMLTAARMRRIVAIALSAAPLGACGHSHPDAPALLASAALAPPPAPSFSAAPAPAPAAPPSASTPPPAPTSRLYVKAHTLPIHADPSLKGKLIGTLVSGDAVALLDQDPRPGPGCASFRAVAPRGWVCEGGDAATTDADDPIVVALRAHAADYSSPWPYAYGESRGARRHRTVPGVDGPAWPASVFDSHLEIPRRSTVAWLDEVDADGGPFLRVDDMTLVRKDRVTPFDHSDFAGVKFDGSVALPIAFFKRTPHARLTHDASGALTAGGEPFARLAFVALTGKTEKHGPHVFWETKEEGVWIDARDAAIVAPDGSATPVGPHATWIEVAALQGWMVAYQDERPVFATMISAGKLGAARPDLDHEPHQPAATTPIGTYRIREKLLTATLQSDLDDGTEFVHAQVPWSQRFYDKYLLHTAYWHDQWGEGHSGGCVNLSPTDAKWLFGWTEPRLPDGWHSVRSSDGDDGPATIVVIHP